MKLNNEIALATPKKIETAESNQISNSITPSKFREYVYAKAYYYM